MSALARRIAERIRREGPIRFDLFQEAALYDPDGGYYERPGRVGRTGDFITASSWHPAFGRTIARTARGLREEEERSSAKGKEGAPRGFREPTDLVDVGAGEGEMLAAADEALRSWEIRDEFHLVGVERSATRRARARERLPAASWVSSFEEIPRVSGLLVAYELFDALPVRALFFEGERLLERVVTLGPGAESFAWGLAECADGDEWLKRFRARGIHLLRDQCLEVREGASLLATSLASRLSSGLLLVFDYGAPARALYSAARANGTLEAFVGHGVTRDVLTEPGSRDLTAWVDFTQIEEALRAAGLAVSGLVSQARFLAAAGIGEEIAAAEAKPTEAERLAERHSLGELAAPGGMGESIRVLVASQNVKWAGRFVEWPSPEIVPSNH
ncbi:MAG: SAM-dependent methyltransferase [Thermoanaerobaculia bacterium]